MSQNTSALKIQNLNRLNVQYINFRTDYPSATYNDQAIKNEVYSPWYSATINPNSTFTVNNLTLRFNRSASFKKDDSWDTIIYIYNSYDLFYDNNKTIVPSPICPTFQSMENSIIDECSIEYHDVVDSPEKLNYDPSSANSYFIRDKLHGYYAMTIKGHFTADGSGNALNLYGRIFAVSNPVSSISGYQFNYLFAFPYFRIYKEVKSAEDQAAEKELESTDNIENQSESDAQGSTNSQTTSLINTLNGFVSAFSNIQASPNCNMTLPFPEFFGGNTNVNICQGKDKAPALISIGSSILLITTFVPLAYILIKMIYNEIRSWTNG